MIDENIKIDISKLPKSLIDCIEKLEYYEKTDDEDNYFYNLDILDVTAKSYVLADKLSEKVYYELLKKYGGEV